MLGDTVHRHLQEETRHEEDMEGGQAQGTVILTLTAHAHTHGQDPRGLDRDLYLRGQGRALRREEEYTAIGTARRRPGEEGGEEARATLAFPATVTGVVLAAEADTEEVDDKTFSNASREHTIRWHGAKV